MHVVLPVDQGVDRWIPWDTDIEETMRFHWVVTDRFLFNDIRSKANRLNFEIVHNGRAHHTALTVMLFPGTEAVYTLAELHNRAHLQNLQIQAVQNSNTTLQTEVTQLRQSLRHQNNLLHTLIDAVARHLPQVRDEFVEQGIWQPAPPATPEDGR